jgi:hypothetical protein
MVTETVKVMAMANPAAVAHRFELQNQKTKKHLAREKHKKQK